MTRRGFFALLGAAFAARALPAAPVTATATAWRDGGHVFYSLPLCPCEACCWVRRVEWEFVHSAPRIGDTIHVKTPIRFKVAP